MAFKFLEREKLRIEKALEERSIKTSRSNRIGAGTLAGPCDRQIWLKWRWVQQNYITPRIKRLFGRGQQEEPIVYAELEDIGVELISAQTFMEFCHGYGGGMDDGQIIGVPDAPKTTHVLEIKTANDKNFQKIKQSGVKIAKKDHYTQFQIYMDLLKLTRTLYVCTNKNDDERHYQRVNFDGVTSKNAQKRCEKIVMSQGPPQKQDPKRFPCHWVVRATKKPGYCEFFQQCYNGKPVDQNCRTCAHVNLLGKGLWGCGQRGDKVLKHPLSRKKRAKGKLSPQEKGCKLWQINPGL